nr:AAA family ATPase [Chloroflexota bacterium]
MRILRVQLTNVKSYKEVEVRFAHGTNCICGENGAGKTTIVEAIGWALFNSLPYSQEKFRRDGTTAAQVSVLF